MSIELKEKHRDFSNDNKVLLIEEAQRFVDSLKSKNIRTKMSKVKEEDFRYNVTVTFWG